MAGHEFKENIGLIDIKDNVFICTCIILPNVEIGSNTIVAAGSYVNKDIPGNGEWRVPAKNTCSMDDCIERRKNQETIVIEKETLPEKTIQACWNRFLKLRN